MARKRQKKKVDIGDKTFRKRLCDFLMDYGNPERIQESIEADTDNQIRSITTHIATIINANTNGTIIDIGCGKGIILGRIASLPIFTGKDGWNYIGTDNQFILKDVIHLSINLGIHKKVDAIPLDIFYEQWPLRSIFPFPHLIIIRNVFHELDIDSTTRLLNHVIRNIDSGDTIIIQDLFVFPKAEKGNVCWIPELFESLLKECYFDTVLVKERSSSGNRWFNITATPSRGVFPSLDEIKEKVINFRTRQLFEWRDLGGLCPDDERFRDVRFAKIDFDLQFGALSFQLQGIAHGVPKLTSVQETLIQKESFEKCLLDFNFPENSEKRIPKKAPRHFRNRANGLDGLVSFMDKNFRLTTITGPPFMGKTELVRYFFFGEAFKHNRLPIFIDVQATASVWNIIETFFSAIGVRLPSEVLQNLKRLSFTNIQKFMRGFCDQYRNHFVIVFDHFENLLEPTGKIFDHEIQQLIAAFSEHEGSKLIITSRQANIDLSFIPLTFIFPTPQPPVARFPRGEHVRNVLQSFLLRENFPDELIDAIDRHPLLATLAGMYLQKYGESSLKDERFISDLKLKMREEIFSKIISGESKDAVEAISRIRIPVPRRMIVKLSNEKSVLSAENIGVIRPELSGRHELITCIGALRIRRSIDSELNLEDNLSIDVSDPITDEKDFQKKIVKCYEELYLEDDNPKWLREIFYHQLIIGDRDLIHKFGSFYRNELFAAGEYWYDREKDFSKALWAYNMAFNFGQRGYYLGMRIASCKVRLGNPTEIEGEKDFGILIKQYPKENGIKSAYVDAKLYKREFKSALDLLNEFGFSESHSWWIAGQFGRAFAGLHEHLKSIHAFNYQLKEKPSPTIYENIARAYNRMGENGKELEILMRALKKHPNNVRLNIYHGSLLERTGDWTGAVDVLWDIYQKDPFNGWVLLPLINALSRYDLDRALEVWRGSIYKIRPDFLKIKIEAEILVRQGKFEHAISVIGQAKDDEHKIRQTLEIYLAWISSSPDKEERKTISDVVFKLPINPVALNDIPILILLCRIALLGENRDKCDSVIQSIEAINPNLFELTRIYEEYNSIWA